MPESRTFEGRTAVITGAGRGLGRAYALEIAAKGGNVVVNDPGVDPTGSGADDSVADKVASEIRARGGKAVASNASIATPEGAESVIELAVRKYGRIDILINNAGFLRDRSFAKMEIRDFEQVIGVHLMGSFYCTHFAWPHMQEQTYGRVVLVASAAGLYGNFGQANYSAAKMGIIGLMNTLRIEGKKHGINVNTVAPLAGTRLTKGLSGGSGIDELPLGAVVALVSHICSDVCAQTGMTYEVAGSKIRRVGIWATQAIDVAPEDLSNGLRLSTCLSPLEHAIGDDEPTNAMNALQSFLSNNHEEG